VLPLRDNVPTRSFPVVTVGLIAANAIVWFWELSKPGVTVHVFRDGFYPCTLSGPCQIPVPVHPLPWYEGVFTGMFMHASWQHILGNMLFLWIFGNNIEDSMSRWRFLTFYLLGGLAASAAQIAVSPGSTTPTLGASGAIAAVLGGYALLYPRARVVTLVFIIIFVTVIELPALVVLGAWFVLQLLDASSQPLGGGGVAYFAHIGGFVFGLLAIRFFANRIREDYDHINRLPVY
jgi:membrane associated rhomboid family serine protease